jgi:hypothetical protein
MSKPGLLVALTAVAAGAWWMTGTPEAERATRQDPTQRAQAAGPVPKTAAGLDWQRRPLSSGAQDLFAAPPEPTRQPKPPASVPEGPRAPPLPYQYDGSGVLQGKSFVFLARNGRSVMANAGDTLDATYLVEMVARDRVVLRYLPLGTRQVLLYAGGEASPDQALAPESGGPVALQVDMPQEVVLGHEFVVTVALPGGGPLKATVEVGYDVEVLSLVGAKQRRGRETIEVTGAGAPRAELRFKVLADSPASTDINFQANASDPSGRRVPVSTQSTYTVSLVLAGGA